MHACLEETDEERGRGVGWAVCQGGRGHSGLKQGHEKRTLGCQGDCEVDFAGCLESRGIEIELAWVH